MVRLEKQSFNPSSCNNWRIKVSVDKFLVHYFPICYCTSYVWKWKVFLPFIYFSFLLIIIDIYIVLFFVVIIMSFLGYLFVFES